MGRKQPCFADGPGGRPRVLRSAIFWRHCRWAFSGMLKSENGLVINFRCSLLRSSDMDAYFRSQELAGARQSWVSGKSQAWLCLANE